MSTENSSSAAHTIPFVIVALSVIAVLAWMLVTIQHLQRQLIAERQSTQEASAETQQPALDQFVELQIKAMKAQRTDLGSSKEKFDSYFVTNMPTFKDQAQKAKQIQETLQKLVLDLLEIAKTDSDAKAIIAKFGIEQKKDADSATPAP